MRLDHLLSREKAELETAKLRDPRSIGCSESGIREIKASETRSECQRTFEESGAKAKDAKGKGTVLPGAEHSVSSSGFGSERFVGV